MTLDILLTPRQNMSMEAISRKQREIVEREQRILALARPILVEEGYQSLSMERLAAKMEYAKGTLYNHFPNKEEIVLALAWESLELRRKMFECAATLSSKSRERMLAIGCACDLYALECPEHFAIEQMLRNSVIWEKSSRKRQDLIRSCELRSMSIVAGIARDAVAAGDLTLPDNMTCEELVFGFWSLTYGSQVLIASSPSLSEIGVADAVRSIRYHAWVLINGFKWRPHLSFPETERLLDSFATKILDHATG
ncbi:MAG: TetR/AcrR family transcriptional regulator [Pirellulaceae bacterium]